MISMRILKVIGSLLWLSCLLSVPAASQTMSPGRLLGRYQQMVWQDQQGLPQNGISAVVQTPDGYLWLATAEGVVRFDGVRFTTFDPGNTNEIKSGNIMSLMVDHTGALWIGTHGGGVARYQDGRFTLYSTNEGLSDTHASSLFEDHAGNIWVGTDGGGLNLFHDGHFVVYSTANGLPDNRIWAFAEDAAGNLWVGTSGGLARFDQGRFTAYTRHDGLPDDQIRALRFDREGTLWIGLQNGVSRLQNGRFTKVEAPDELKNNFIRAISEDREGSLWFGTSGHGVYRLKDGHFDACGTKEGLAHDIIQAIFQDQMGDLWLGTSGGGLVQLRSGRFRVYSEGDGLPHPMVRAVYEDRLGNIWVGTDEGLCRFMEGKFVVYTTRDGQPLHNVTGIASDHEGNLLIKASRPATGTLVLRLREGSSVLEPVKEALLNNASVILPSHTGDIWFGTSYDGLHRLRDGRSTVYHKRDGLADDYVDVLFEDRAGTLWIGTRGGFSRFKDEKLTRWASKEGFAGRLVLSFYEDRAGALWVGTDGDGLFRFKDGKFAVITTRNGLYDNLAFQILEDDNGNLWMSGNKGIYRASLKELNDFADGRISAVSSFAYGTADGMLSRECNGANPAGVKARDGRLWFPTIKGVVVVDPRESDQKPPLISVEQVTLDGASLPLGQPIRVKSGQENLEIQYTALSWNRPQQVRFKYQLVGLGDDVWVDAGTRRTAYLSHLPPGQYSFRVIADNGEGVWNTAGRVLNIVVLPPFYRTWWFIALAVLGVSGVVLLAFKFRLGHLEREARAQEEFSRSLLASQEQERQRIASALHDSLGQSLLIIKNRIALARSDINDKEIVDEQLGELSQSASHAIEECREIAYNLLPFQIERFGLSKTLHAIFMRLSEVTNINAVAEIEPIDDVLTEEAQISVYRIVQECVNNIIKHSHATEATLVIKRNAGGIGLLIQDNGRGFGSGPHSADATKRSGFGLMGMAERVKMLGGSFEIDSTHGTSIRIHLNAGA
jgi:ligand-binding sensor domain-containing protein/signal transduction histidine kinase